MPGQTPQTGSPEPLGLQVAGEVQKAVAPATVILYGSRAAGDHRPDSDVDLMIIAPDRSAAGSATADANHWLRTAGPDLDVNITTLTQEEFDSRRRLGQSLAGQASRHGVDPMGERLDYNPQYDPHEEEIWEETRTWLERGLEHLQGFRLLLGFSKGEYMNKVKLLVPYGLDRLTGRMLHVDKVPNGKDSGVVCPSCKFGLVAKNAGTHKTHHFAHAGAGDNAGACEGWLHATAKWLLYERIQDALADGSRILIQNGNAKTVPVCTKATCLKVLPLFGKKLSCQAQIYARTFCWRRMASR